MSYQHIGKKQLSIFCHHLPTLKKLETINLSHNEVNDECEDELSKFLSLKRNSFIKLYPYLYFFS